MTLNEFVVKVKDELESEGFPISYYDGFPCVRKEDLTPDLKDKLLNQKFKTPFKMNISDIGVLFTPTYIND